MNALFSPRAQLIIGWALLVIGFIGWPLSAFTLAKQEPPFILGLSWGAIILTAWGIIVACQINQDVETGCPHVCRDCAPPAAQAEDRPSERE